MLFGAKKPASVQWMLVFLGNPGKEYDNTRHNAGFLAAEVLERKTGQKIKRIKFKALVADFEFAGVHVLAMKPQTFMNLSGEAVQEAAAFYKIPPERIIVACDDISLEPGKLRLRRKGSAGGHNGLKSIISMLKSDQFPRVKIGVGQKPHPDYDLAAWVLGKFQGDDKKKMDEAAEHAVEAMACIIEQGMDQAMNRYN